MDVVAKHVAKKVVKVPMATLAIVRTIALSSCKSDSARQLGSMRIAPPAMTTGQNTSSPGNMCVYMPTLPKPPPNTRARKAIPTDDASLAALKFCPFSSYSSELSASFKAAAHAGFALAAAKKPPRVEFIPSKTMAWYLAQPDRWPVLTAIRMPLTIARMHWKMSRRRVEALMFPRMIAG